MAELDQPINEARKISDKQRIAHANHLANKFGDDYGIEQDTIDIGEFDPDFDSFSTGDDMDITPDYYGEPRKQRWDRDDTSEYDILDKVWPGPGDDEERKSDNQERGAKLAAEKRFGKKVDENISECPECDAKAEQQSQQDSVTATLNINGAGPGGIRDMIDILRNIENTKSSSGDFGHDVEEPLMGDGYENSIKNGKSAEVFGVDAITATGNDMHSKGKGAFKVNGGENPFNIAESLISDLKRLYENVKIRPVREGIGRGHPDWPVTDQPEHKKARPTGGSTDEWGPEDYERERHYARQDAAADNRSQEAKKTKWIHEKGTAPNGEEFNALYVVMADTEDKAREEVLSTADFHRGAKKFLDLEFKPAGENVMAIAYVFDRHA